MPIIWGNKEKPLGESDPAISINGLLEAPLQVSIQVKGKLWWGSWMHVVFCRLSHGRVNALTDFAQLHHIKTIMLLILHQAGYVAFNKKLFIETVNSCAVCNTRAVILLTRPFFFKYKTKTKLVPPPKKLKTSVKWMRVTREHIQHMVYWFCIYIISLLKMLTHTVSYHKMEVLRVKAASLYVCVCVCVCVCARERERERERLSCSLIQIYSEFKHLRWQNIMSAPFFCLKESLK